MNSNKVLANLDALFGERFQEQQNSYFEDGFREAISNNPEAINLMTAKEDSVDVEWLSFFWWIFKNDQARVSDAVHGCVWTPDEKIIKTNPVGSFSRTILIDPIAHAEKTKIKDYLKHINWIYHKTQNLPRITVIGSDNIPERLYGLRQSIITLLDPKQVLPKEKLFDDHIQRKNFGVAYSDDIFDELGSHNDMLGTQNVVIIDSCDTHKLAETIHDTGLLLTSHGRILFDIPMYSNCLQYSLLFKAASMIVPANKERYFSDDATFVDEYVHRLVKNINELAKRDDYYFEIEEMKLTDGGTGMERSVAMRVYLKKDFYD